MNTQYLMAHISRQLHTYVRQFSPDGQLLLEVCERFHFYTPGIDSINISFYISRTLDENMPLLFADQNAVTYAIVSADSSLLLIGPSLLPKSYIKNTLPGISSFSTEWLYEVSTCDLETLAANVLLVHNLCHSSTIQIKDFISYNCIDPEDEHQVQKYYSAIIFEQLEAGTKHNPYDQEVRELTSIRNGDLKQLEKSWAEDYIGTLGVLAKTKLRSTQNLSIALITLASRAAIEGGIPSEVAYSLCDSYICHIEELTDVTNIFYLARQAELQYARMVHDSKIKLSNQEKNWSLRVNLCKEYIFNHLHEKLSVKSIAAELAIHPNYLSNIFKKCESITITQFILCEKINLAKNMLVYSQYSYIEIATYLGFASQSHFGTQFKRITGVTPRMYREVYGVNKFLS